MLRDKRRLAIKMRREGKSYNEIRATLSVAKSSLSYWLKNYPLADKQIEDLKNRYKAKQIENFRNTMREKRRQKLLATYKEQEKSLLPLTEKELLVAGLFLYLGEGAKQTPSQILLSNTDPNIIKFTLCWYAKALKIPKNKVKVGLQLYKDMNPKKEINYWSRLLDLPLSNFWRPYIKKSTTKDIDHTGFKHGTCTLYYGSISIHDRIMMSIRCILDKVNNGPVV